MNISVLTIQFAYFGDFFWSTYPYSLILGLWWRTGFAFDDSSWWFFPSRSGGWVLYGVYVLLEAYLVRIWACWLRGRLLGLWPMPCFGKKLNLKSGSALFYGYSGTFQCSNNKIIRSTKKKRNGTKKYQAFWPARPSIKTVYENWTVDSLLILLVTILHLTIAVFWFACQTYPQNIQSF